MNETPRQPFSASPHPSLTASQLTLARSRAYELFGRLYLYGLTEKTLPDVQAIPVLAAALPETFDADAAAADHQHLFGFNVFPFESIFLDPAGLLGGDVSESVLHYYRQAGFDPQVSSESVDHIGHQLRFLAFLCRLQRHEEENAAGRSELGPDARSNETQRPVRLQRDFLDRHLLRWLLPLVLAIHQQNDTFYTALADLTLDLVAQHWDEVGAGRRAGFQLATPPNLLEDNEAGLKDFVAYLLTPVYSGLYLGRDDIGRLARQHALPSGFGSRQQMFQNLLRSAANYDGLDPVMGRLEALATEWSSAYEEMAVDESIRSFAEHWRSRSGKTVTLLGEMSQRLDV